jgi:hypothetical protein
MIMTQVNYTSKLDRPRISESSNILREIMLELFSKNLGIIREVKVHSVFSKATPDIENDSSTELGKFF